MHLWILEGLTSVAQFHLLVAFRFAAVDGTVDGGPDVLVILAVLTTFS